MSTNTKMAEALRLGQEGAPATEEERLLFEAWMRGHCWALCATWNGNQYVSDAEQGGNVDPRAMNTRQIFAAWRDRAALAAHDAERAQPMSPKCVSGTSEQAAKAVPAPSAEHIKAVARELVIQAMEQAQVFASSWALVGSRFDAGNELDNAEQQKADLRTIIQTLADLAAETVRPIAAPTPPAPEAQQPAGQEQDERAAFEEWAISYSTIPLKRDDDASLGFTGYTEMDQTMLWDAWQARAARAQRREPLTDLQISAAIDARLSLHMQNGIEDPFSLMVARAIEAAHGIGAPTGKEPGNV